MSDIITTPAARAVGTDPAAPQAAAPGHRALLTTADVAGCGCWAGTQDSTVKEDR